MEDIHLFLHFCNYAFQTNLLKNKLFPLRERMINCTSSTLNICSWKTMKINHIREKCFQNTSDKGLVFRIYEPFLHLSQWVTDESVFEQIFNPWRCKSSKWAHGEADSNTGNQGMWTDAGLDTITYPLQSLKDTQYQLVWGCGTTRKTSNTLLAATQDGTVTLQNRSMVLVLCLHG